MEITSTKLKDVYIINPKWIGDHRGWFEESWTKRDFEEAGLFYDFVQDNHSYSSAKGTLRGLHYQEGEYSQAKLVRCTRGAILDVVVDLRRSSPTYKQWISVELSEQNHLELMVPRGMAHGFVTLTDEVEFLYRVDNYYAPGHEFSIKFDDPTFNIDWGFSEGEKPVLAAKDEAAPYFTEDMAFEL